MNSEQAKKIILSDPEVAAEYAKVDMEWELKRLQVQIDLYVKGKVLEVLDRIENHCGRSWDNSVDTGDVWDLGDVKDAIATIRKELEKGTND